MQLRPGDVVGTGGRFVVARVAGKGVFASVAICEDKTGPTADPGRADGAIDLSTVEAIGGSAGSTVAIKVARANDVMRKTAMKEAGILASLAAADRLDRCHVVRLRGFFEWRRHVCLVFEAMQMNLRELIDRFGKRVGLAATAVRALGRQLLTALRLLERQGVVHADIKPQNIVVNSDHTSCKLCDLGSAFLVDGPDNVPAPLLVSRFYRPPEVILGFQHTVALDLWSVGCVLFEMYTGSVLFDGSDNSDMLWRIMSLQGPVHDKTIRSHLRQCADTGMEPLFDESLKFIRHGRDPVTSEPVARPVRVTKSWGDLASRLVPSTLQGHERRAALRLKDLLERMLCVDPKRRISVKDALDHPFFATAQHPAAEASVACATGPSASSSAAASGHNAAPPPASQLRPAAIRLRPSVTMSRSRTSGASGWRPPASWSK